MKIDIRDVPVYFINLDKDIDKRKSTESVLNKIGFKTITRIAGTVNENSALGCTLAHYNALKIAINECNSPFLVVEDDIVLNNKKTIFNIPENSDAIYLGLSMWGVYNGTGHVQISADKHDESFYKLHNMLSTHAVMYTNKDYVRLLLKCYEFSIKTKEPLDKANAELMKYFEVYGLSNPVFYQEGINERWTNFTLPSKKTFGIKHASMLR
jgi:GR25 family glycosyltransferase involved in LPS biosynthesis